MIPAQVKIIIPYSKSLKNEENPEVSENSGEYIPKKTPNIPCIYNNIIEKKLVFLKTSDILPL